MKIGIIIADELEFVPFADTVLSEYSVIKKVVLGYNCICFSVNNTEVTAFESRIGKVNAATCASILAVEGCDVILNAGLSGSVKGLRRGQLVIGKSYVEADFDLSVLGLTPGEKPKQEYIYKADDKIVNILKNITNAVVEPIGCGDFFITNDELKDKYHNIFGIAAFDMETGAIASVCHAAEIAFASIRKISDGDEQSEDAAYEYRQMNDKMETELYEILLKAVKELAV